MSDASVPRSRSAFTLIEVACSILVLTAFLALSQRALMMMVRELGPSSALSDHGVILDMVCDRLRRDLAPGASIDGSTLIAGGARWRMDGSWLTRNGAHELTGCTVAWRILPDGAAVVEIASRARASASAGTRATPPRIIQVHPGAAP